MSILSQPYFHNEEAAYAFVESRLWPNGPVCPHCGCIERIGKMGGKSTRIGTYKCYNCRKPFTVKVGTIFQSSHIPMRLWLQAMFLISSSKKGISSNQLHRTLGITLKSAWFMSHRIREAMKDGGLPPFGGNGGIVEIDEAYIGIDKRKPKPKQGPAQKRKVLSLIDRTTGRSRSLVMDSFKKHELWPVLMANIDRNTNIVTDESVIYSNLRPYFRDHASVNHSRGEYVNAEHPVVHTNTIEGFFSIFKRGMKGVYQHCGHHHLNRYLAEFDFRYSNRKALGISDAERADNLLRGVKGKRLTYETTC
jgi:transposase-like protein